ncbi:DUF3213 domain-containing protein [Palaeococcus ferrophilus]|uniref:DUF3213 domain-containing protein n=1 Tax=Palaeococcus ferrophilus TaxID=83868 RepID=UPI00064F7D79|nr:DUF3213 domain-containing protein [Palaeococcus ferrophilus]
MVKPDKRLTKLVLKLTSADWENTSAKQYEIAKEIGVWRVFLNGYSKRGVVVFDEEVLPREELLKRLEDLKPEIVTEESLMVQELIVGSMGSNNVLVNH